MEGNKGKIKGHLRRGISGLLLFLIMLSSCSAPKIRPKAESFRLPTAELENGLVLFNEYCASCHPGGMSGVGPAIINKPLPAPLIRFQIRNGVGLMPAFDEEKLSDKQVENIADYIVYLREKD